jgi:ABC-type transporter Mla maintaining outer membrane lipid asymmetry permease subunit MlaE
VRAVVSHRHISLSVCLLQLSIYLARVWGSSFWQRLARRVLAAIREIGPLITSIVLAGIAGPAADIKLPLGTDFSSVYP